MEEESAARGGIEGVGKLPSAAPAFFVILTPSQGDGSKEEGILVANRDVSSVAPVITTGSDQSKSDFFLSSNCTSGEITVTLDNNNMWNEFYRCNTEMVLTKQGRRMFPYCRYWISGLNPYLKYILVMDITPLDNQRYKWNGKWWEPAGKADPHVLGRVFIHPESPSTGQYWMHQPVSFYKLKLTNNILDQEGHIILHSMHRYLPRLHVVPAEKSPEVIQLNGPDVHTFTFPQTEFIAVTAYQNFQITQLKIDCNPFAKGFREGTVPGRPVKDLKHKPSEQEVDASSSKNLEENEDPDRMKKLQELFKMSEYLDGDKENDIFNSVREFLKLTQSTPVLDKDTKPDEDVLKRFAEHSSVASLSTPSEQLSVEVKKEPEDDYDYSKTSASAIESVAVKQEQSDTEDADVDYPILEKHFAKFKEDPYLDGNHSSDSPTGVAKAKLLELDQGSMCLEPCAADNHLEAPDLPKPVLPEDTLQDMDAQDSTLRTESPPICPSPSVNSQVGVDVSVKEKRKRICKNKIDEIYATLQTALRTSRGPKRKCPLLFPKPPVTPTPGNEGTVTPIAKKRGRPPKPKISKVGRPAKKDNPIEAPRLFPDFNPDLEDVDGVLFVAFSSKEALDVHMENKPPDTEPSSLSTPEANSELTDEMQKILRLERQLLTHLKTMKNRQVIHPALQQVGIKLNIVDPAMSIDLRYLGVELTLLSITSDANYDDNGLCAQGWPFVSRTGKTTDYTKIKGWRDKFSTEPATSSHKNEAGRKNLSAFCSDELDEYLENEAKLMGDLKELTWHKPESSVSYQLPTKSSSYVRTLDSVLKKQAQQAKSSLNTAEQFPVPRKKRKYTRRVFTPKPDSKARPIIPASITVKEKSAKPHSVQKKDHSASHFLNKVPSTPSSSVECLSESQPVLKPSEDEQNGTVQPNLVASGEGNVFLNLQTQQASKPIGFSKVQMKLLELEECAMWEGKPRTYITKERADLSLSTLLTAQASLRNKPIQKLINKRTDLCNKDFCRLGCICSSLSLTKHTDTHCQHETCMFSCDCLKNKHSGKDGLKDETTQNKSETAFSLVPGCGYQPVQAEKTVKSPEARQTEEQQEMTVDGSGKAKKRKFTEGNDRKSDVRTPVPFPIWNRSDVADDPEPLCIPEQAEFVGPKILHKEHTVKGKSPGGGGKVGRPSSVAHIHPEDPMYLYSNSMKTCARVRAYQRKAPEEKKMKDQSICGSDTPGKEHNLKSSKTRAQEKDANKEDEIVEKKCDTMNNNGPSKLIDIISDCSREEDDSKVLNITSQRMTRKEPQSFKVGSFNVELKQENGIGEKSASGTFCSRVKIAVSAEKQVNSDTPNPRPVNAENAKPSEEPEDKPADIEAKSHGGKGLPFYAKVIPAGKLVAHLKTSDVNQAQLVEVNGKNHTQAKLLLGQMGALHPANRLAAYVTRRLQPNLSHLSKVNEVSAKMATKSLSSNVITEDKSKDILPSQQNKTVSNSPVPALNPSKVTSGPGKRLGPRLLLIPVNSSSSPSRPVQRVQSSPGQKMVLQPIKTTCGVTLFRHPNGQIVQLVPLQVQSSNVQPSRQQVIIRNPGPVMGARFPLLTKSEASASTSVSIPGTTVPPASPSSNLPVLSPSKTSPNKSGTAIFPQNPPMLSQLGSLVVKASPPKRNCEASLPFPKVVTYTASEHAVITSKVMPLLSAGLSLPNIPPPPLQNNSPANASTKPNLTLMGNKPGTTSTPNEEDKKLSDSLSPLKYGLSGEKSDKEVVKECEGQPTSEIVNDGNGPEVQKSTNQQNKSVTEEVDTIAKEEQCQNGQQDNGQLSIDSINELFASNVDLQEPRKKDSQDVLMRRNQGPADNGESQQCIADNTNSQEKIGDSSPVTLASAEHVAAGVEQNTLCKTGEKAELSMEQKSAKSQDSVSSSDQNNCESLQVDPQAKKVSKWIDSKETISDDQEIQSNLQSEEESDIDSDSVDIETVEELSDMIAGAKAYAAVVLKCTPGKVCENDSKSEVDEYVDIETLEALSEKINVTYRKESAHLNKDMCDTEGKSSKEQKKGSKMTGEDIFSEALDEGTNIFHRKNHTANERKRRSELRDLFEELRNALGLHNLPKVSKGFILKQAIEEIKDLTDTADTLIKKKTLLSQTQAQLIKKVSNLSGKSREVVLKKLENLYAKQKAVETEQQKKNLEEDVALDIAPMILPPPKQEPFFPLKLQEETNETLSGKTKKPIILTRKALFHPKEGNQLQPGVPLTTSNVLMAPTGQVGKQEHGVAGQVAGIPSTLIQADLSPVQIQSGMASVVIQLPSAIKLKDIIPNNPVPIALPTVPGDVSTASSFGPVSDEDDLTMMPKIVNVMSLALEAKSDMGMEIGISGTEKEWKSDACSLTTEAYARGNAPAQDACYVTAKSCVPSTSVPVDKKKEEVADPARKSCSPYSSLHENLPQENYSGNTEASLKTKDVSVSITPPTETVDDTRGSKLDLELKKLTSAIDEAGLDPTELPDTMGDPEEADETLTSLLDEIAFLNQQINSDADALESVSDFPGPDTVSHSDVSKFADSAPFSFGRFKDGPETKDNISFSPLFMQLEEGEILDNSKLNEGASLGVFAGGARKEPHLTEAAGTSIGLRQPPATVPTYQRTDQSMGSCSDVFWRPMPKLAPLGLKSCTLPSDQRVLASKPMPSLASVAMKLSSPESTD
ncbi:MAX gene-associated protein isoform X7 [Bufo gargarizans]|uniref:MAX gene-associated protein isoform X7 n=1 Tax=Bufo gargarizans TaxID=30331 RepID=UPI001CF49166|nr:MAX gene-associated protein isoform X7 [Bufo gargarizans]